MNSEFESVFAVDPSAVVLGELKVVTVDSEELPRAVRLLEEEHYLGAARPVGRTLVQAVHHQGNWVALLVWGPAALKLADRDAEIGWTDSQRAERIGLLPTVARRDLHRHRSVRGHLLQSRRLAALRHHQRFHPGAPRRLFFPQQSAKKTLATRASPQRRTHAMQHRDAAAICRRPQPQ